MDYDSGVVGGGVMGYSAAVELSKTGRKTVLLEQFPSPHTRGSSTGQTRVTRVANYGAKELNPIMVAALAAWKEIQREVDKELFVPCPMLCIGRGEEMGRMRTAIEASGSAPKICSAQHIRDSYGYCFDEDCEFFIDQEAGVLLADQCILALKKLFEQNGGKVLDRFQVTRIEREHSSNTVLAHGPNDRVIRAAKLVVCAGAWTAPLMETLGVTLPLQATKIAVCYWRQRDPSIPSLIFITTDDKEGHYYGLPPLEYPGMIKICAHVGVPCDPNNRDRTSVAGMVASSSQYVKNHYCNLEPEPAIVESCMYTMTPDEEMILDWLPSCPNVAFACGFSGTGFKIGPTVGKLLCQMVTGEKLDHEIGRFSAGRFTT